MTGAPSSSKKAVILASVFAAALALVAIAFAIWRVRHWYRWRPFSKLQNSLERNTNKLSNRYTNKGFAQNESVPINDQTNLIEYDRNKYELFLEHIRFEEQSHSTTRTGNFSKVVLAKLRQFDGTETDVAVKSPLVNKKVFRKSL